MVNGVAKNIKKYLCIDLNANLNIFMKLKKYISNVSHLNPSMPLYRRLVLKKIEMTICNIVTFTLHRLSIVN